MNSDARLLRIHNDCPGATWPPGTLCVFHLGDAWVLRAAVDFGLGDLVLVRHRFPDQHVTLDGDVITVWPRPREAP
ncbi:hypothetical protein BN159_0425 [Streptomyces davaonensis JCM 4913]|uniref:Uncharacterized protein n=1 Tax=Streptomyces davaonensis (strain DSM 101723 / JCM 4913 / KCC S-0913 / 768) TaxID=1214101 RepID=K4QWS6_STRDJ|nr:hypothetical protein [Streptomyces davaonensis]CCK24804.1 hypothetical protein BN159_0425 [Streptomyces davaonensis JCM 4913]